MSFIPLPRVKAVKIRFNTTGHQSNGTPVSLAKGTEFTLVARSHEESLVRSAEGKSFCVHHELLVDSDHRVTLEKPERVAIDEERAVPLDADAAVKVTIFAHEEVALIAVESAVGICKARDGKTVRIPLAQLEKIQIRDAVAV